MPLGTSFLEDSFSIYPGGRGGFWMVQALPLYYAARCDEVIRGEAQAVMRAMGSGCECKYWFRLSRLLSSSVWPVPSRSWTGTSSGVEDSCSKGHASEVEQQGGRGKLLSCKDLGVCLPQGRQLQRRFLVGFPLYPWRNHFCT